MRLRGDLLYILLRGFRLRDLQKIATDYARQVLLRESRAIQLELFVLDVNVCAQQFPRRSR